MMTRKVKRFMESRMTNALFSVNPANSFGLCISRVEQSPLSPDNRAGVNTFSM
jgi:hypothetical protein